MVRSPLARAITRALGVVFASGFAAAQAQPVQTPLDGSTIPQFVDPLPTFAGQRIGGPLVFVSFKETTQKPLPASFYASLPVPFRAGTTVWGYQVSGLDVSTGFPVTRGPSWPGITVEAKRNVPTSVLYTNDLRTPKLQKLLPVDQTLGWADPLKLGCIFDPMPSMDCMQQYTGPVPMVVHLHGSEVPPAFDGGPDAWFTSTGLRGSNYSSLLPVLGNQAVYRYPNSQEATTLWFHDHALGTTRLNVFGGVAAFYFLRDDKDTGRADNPLRLPAGNQEVELVIQDRSFDTNGQLLYYDATQLSSPDLHPFWRPEFFGDVITVNGKSWPVFQVEPRRYRLRFLNGSNARFYNLAFTDGGASVPVPFWQIGTDGGFLDSPAPLQSLLIAPGERADVIVDFTGFAGQTFLVTNDANEPFPDGDPIDPATTGRIMKIRVAKKASAPDTTCNPATNGCQLRPGHPIVRLAEGGDIAAGVTPAVKRQLILKEIATETGPREVLLNNGRYSGFKESTLKGTLTPLPDSVGLGDNFVSEAPRVGSTEIWEVANITVDAHPIHVHLVQFQVINRQLLDTGETDQGEPLGYLATWLGSFADPVASEGDGPPFPYLNPNADGAVGGNPAFSPFLIPGSVSAPEASEAGWKDTVIMRPGQVTRLAVRWAPQRLAVNAVAPGDNRYPFDPSLTSPKARDVFGNPGAAGYAWHCHILEHEDDEMMRPYAVAR